MAGLSLAAPESLILLVANVVRHILLDGAAQALCYLPDKARILSAHSIGHAAYVCLPQIALNLLWQCFVCPERYRAIWTTAVTWAGPCTEMLSHMVIDSTKARWKQSHAALLQGQRGKQAAFLMHLIDQAAHCVVIIVLWMCMIFSCVESSA